MKKFTRISLILALALTIIGVGCLGAGIALGGTWKDLGEAFDRGDFSFGDSYDIESDQENDPVVGKDLTDEISNQIQGTSYKDVKEISVEVKKGILYYEVGNTKDIQVSVQNIDGDDETVIDQDGESLEITNTDLRASGSITIYLPKNYKLDQMDISMGAGEVICETSITVDELDVEIGAGSFKGSGAIHAKDSDWQVDAGELILDNLTGTDMDFECKAGSIEANINGQQDDFAYDLSCKLGSISVGKEEFNGTVKKKINTKKDKIIDASCGIGSIKLDFIN